MVICYSQNEKLIQKERHNAIEAIHEEIIADNFPKLIKEIISQIEEI